MPKAGRSILRPFDKTKIRYNLNCPANPDTADRGRVRFPNLCVKPRLSARRTASPPPRRDDPENLYEENRRRLHGLRALGPICKVGRPECREFKRNLRWEMALPDREVPIPWERDLPKTPGYKKRAGSPGPDGARKKPRESETDGHHRAGDREERPGPSGQRYEPRNHQRSGERGRQDKDAKYYKQRDDRKRR